MFTGIVEAQGVVAGVEGGSSGLALELDLGPLAAELTLGESVAVDGCCLTVARLAPPRAGFDAVPETLQRTNLGRLRVGRRVNVERAMRLGDRLGGHIVTGHVDAVGEVTAVAERGNERVLHVRVPASARAYLVEKGSITVDGVSLTVAELTADGFRVALVPHTLAVTSLAERGPGDPVHLETDVLARFVARLLEQGRVPPNTAWQQL